MQTNIAYTKVKGMNKDARTSNIRRGEQVSVSRPIEFEGQQVATLSLFTKDISQMNDPDDIPFLKKYRRTVEEVYRKIGYFKEPKNLGWKAAKTVIALSLHSPKQSPMEGILLGGSVLTEPKLLFESPPLDYLNPDAQPQLVEHLAELFGMTMEEMATTNVVEVTKGLVVQKALGAGRQEENDSFLMEYLKDQATKLLSINVLFKIPSLVSKLIKAYNSGEKTIKKEIGSILSDFADQIKKNTRPAREEYNELIMKNVLLAPKPSGHTIVMAVGVFPEERRHPSGLPPLAVGLESVGIKTHIIPLTSEAIPGFPEQPFQKEVIDMFSGEKALNIDENGKAHGRLGILVGLVPPKE